MLSIPEPCHEDFSKMTPTERGSFCGKCHIDTFDFRSLSDSQINKLLLENMNQHLCGQFTKTQLNSLNRGFMDWKNQKRNTFRSKFLLALVLVFGLSLFSCNNEEEKVILQVQALALSGTVDRSNFVNELQDEQELDLLDYVADDEGISVNGSCESPGLIGFEELLSEPQHEIMAGIPEMVSEIRGEPQVVQMTIAGGLKSTSYLDYLEDTVITENTPLMNEKQNLPQTPFEVSAYPNPTQGNSTLMLEVKTAGPFEIGLFDLSGRLVTRIYGGLLEKGRQSFTVNLDAQPTGMYLIKIASGSQQESVKVQKVN